MIGIFDVVGLELTKIHEYPSRRVGRLSSSFLIEQVYAIRHVYPERIQSRLLGD